MRSDAFFTPVGLPQLDKAGKNVFRFVNSAFSPEPLDRRQGVEHEVRAEVKFQRFLPYHISGTVNGLTLGRKRRMGAAVDVVPAIPGPAAPCSHGC